jgi:hypothetical protein
VHRWASPIGPVREVVQHCLVADLIQLVHYSATGRHEITTERVSCRSRRWKAVSGIRGAPIAYRLDGKEYIAVASGMADAVGGFTGAGAPWMRHYRSGGTLYVFRLYVFRLYVFRLYVFRLFETGASEAFQGGSRQE